MPRDQALTSVDEERVWSLWLRHTPRPEIARQVGTSVSTVTAAVKRVRLRLTQAHLGELEHARSDALAEYREIAREAWSRLAGCPDNSNAGVGYLGAIIEARTRQDQLLGLEELTVNVRAVQLSRVEHILSSPVPIQLPGAIVVDG